MKPFPQKKVAWITGGARMGLAVAEHIAAQGFHALLTYRRTRVPAGTSQLDQLRCDVTRATDLKKMVLTLRRRFGKLDLLVHMASIYERENWEGHWKTHVEGAYHLTAAAAPLLRAADPGRVILFSDWTAASGRPRYKGYLPYFVSKAAVQALVEALALEWAPKILVNGIAPGPILAPSHLIPEERRAVEKATPLGRWGGAREIARVVGFLAESEFMTGEVIRVDGGRHLL